MQINSYNSVSTKTIYPLNHQKTSFCGMTKKMKKQTYIDGQRDIANFIQERGDKNLMVGRLPEFMLNKIPKENRKDAIMDIYKTFDEVTEELRDFNETKVDTIREITKRRNDSTVKKLEDVLIKHNIISKWDDFDLEYLGKGGKGSAYKLVGLRDLKSFDEDEFVIKVFHVVKGDNWQHYKSHGCYAEINSAAYWMKNVGHDTNRGKFFWGSLKSGYMINKYVDEDVRLPKRTINPYRYGLKPTDEDALKQHNICKGYSYDWGGVRVINRIKNSDNYARRISEIIRDTPERYREAKWWEIYNKKEANMVSKYAGLAMGIKHMPSKTKYIDTCLDLNKQKVNQGLSYVLKYLKFDDAIKYYKTLMQRGDVTTQIILFNEIPLLSMQHRDKEVKDDLQTLKSDIIDSRIEQYYKISEKYTYPEASEHLASFVHLLPDKHFRSNYQTLAQMHNSTMHDRLIYKIPNIPKEHYNFAMEQLTRNVQDEKLLKKLINIISEDPDLMKKTEKILLKRGMKIV